MKRPPHEDEGHADAKTRVDAATMVEVVIVAILFGALGFIYVFSLGRRLSGAGAGVIAVLVLFTFTPLVFDHGLRSNNMEAPLFLAYCAGVYHFSR